MTNTSKMVLLDCLVASLKPSLFILLAKQKVMSLLESMECIRGQKMTLFWGVSQELKAEKGQEGSKLQQWVWLAIIQKWVEYIVCTPTKHSLKIKLLIQVSSIRTLVLVAIF